MKALILCLNGFGLLCYLYWLVSKAGQVFYTQEGVLYLLPVLPFVLVFVLVLAPKHEEEENGEEEDG